MSPRRLELQLNEAMMAENDGVFAIIGSQFHRHPEESTQRYTKWANTLDPHLLNVQVS